MLKSGSLFLLVALSIPAMAITACGQNAAPDEKADGAVDVSDVLTSVGASDMLQTAIEIRKASESLERFGESLEEISTVAGEAADSTTRNLAAVGGEFDPFGFQAAFETIQQQNAIIQAQHRLIIDLQQQEIRRLKAELAQSKPMRRRSRRRNPVRESDE